MPQFAICTSAKMHSSFIHRIHVKSSTKVRTFKIATKKLSALKLCPDALYIGFFTFPVMTNWSSKNYEIPVIQIYIQ